MLGHVALCTMYMWFIFFNLCPNVKIVYGEYVQCTYANCIPNTSFMLKYFLNNPFLFVCKAQKAFYISISVFKLKFLDICKAQNALFSNLK